MSLDVELVLGRTLKKCVHCDGSGDYVETDTAYERNITHNLNTMAARAGIYKHIWRPEELDITKAEQLIKPLEEGLRLLKKYPDFFKEFNAPNGWGTYEHFVPFVSEYLQACKENPDAEVKAFR